MRRVLYAVIVLVMVAGVAAAQDFPRVEVFGGYDLLKLGGSDVNELTDAWESEHPDDASFDSSKLLKKGFDASITFNANKYFGIEANFLYNKGTLIEGSGNAEGEYHSELDLSDFAFMAGPRFAYRKNERVTPFAHALFGVSRIKADPSLTIDGSSADFLDDFEGSDTGFGMAFGGGIDVNVNDALAVRLIQADYFMSKHEDFNAHNINLAFGVVFRLGGK